jgi:hypothetical protein
LGQKTNANYPKSRIPASERTCSLVKWTASQAGFGRLHHLAQARPGNGAARMVKSGNVYPVTQTFQRDQDRLMALAEPIGHIPKHRVRWIGGAVRADRTPGQVATQGQALLVTQHLVSGVAKVRLHDRFQFRLYLLHIGYVEFVQVATDGGIVPPGTELNIPGILYRLILRQRVCPQVQVFQVLAPRQGGQPKFEDQVASRKRILVPAWRSASGRPM